jgi:hypothetical protein
MATKIVAARTMLQRLRSALGGSMASVKLRIVLSFFQVGCRHIDRDRIAFA